MIQQGTSVCNVLSRHNYARQIVYVLKVKQIKYFPNNNNICLSKQINFDVCLDFSPPFSHMLVTVTFSSSLVGIVVPELYEDILLKMPGYLNVKETKNLGRFAVWD